MAEDELLTATKVADKLGVKPAIVKKYIEEHEIHPDKTKGSCKYYAPPTVNKIKRGCGCK